MGFQLNSQNLKNISEKYNRNYLYHDEFYDEDGKLTKKVNDAAEKEVVY